MRKNRDVFHIGLMAAALSFMGVAASSASAMSFFDAEEYEAAASANMKLEEKVEVAVPVEPTVMELPDKLNTITDSLENDQDVKYYSFTAVRGQKVMIHEIRLPNELSPWKIEHKVDQDWYLMPSIGSHITSTLVPQQKVQVRVSRNPAVLRQPGQSYKIEFGSAPRLTKHNIIKDGDRYNIYFGQALFINKVEWSTHVIDSTGHPIEGVTVELNFDLDQHAPFTNVVDKRVSNQSGFIWSTFNLGACIGKNTTKPFVGVFDFRTKWQLTYNTGYYFMSPQGNDDGGVGSRDGRKVSLVHICNQRIVK
ncbi:hypothetical protein [Pseudomonas sp. NA-150]|uniref:hypothetical protein n=1 Tax=Pseudomonas sp. NA-150 TaxID=3367525 RepID=UPI0037C8A9BB